MPEGTIREDSGVRLLVEAAPRPASRPVALPELEDLRR
ncbi:hypothetical protein FHX52_2728 [Humibacillus xanthopallidus]|uniref:Uncharacterized protein n=1 Tax=Humibacillus xanthopallidus TaxID=412689 RepID=A0A543PPM5_9MICO|nr:hypothetical protein FHX52_2728 [Humibacillus xanthopallidus]